MKQSKFWALPKTVLGKWSLRLIIIFFLLFILIILLTTLGHVGQREGEDSSIKLLLAIPGILMAISGIAAFITGIISIVKKKERSFLVFFSTLIGFFVLLFMAGEILVPH